MQPSRVSASTLEVLQRVRSLSRQSVRDHAGCYWIEGVRQFIQATDAGLAVDTIVLSPILLSNSLPEMIARRLVRTGVPRVNVTPEQFRSISILPRACGIGAILRQHWVSLEQADSRRGLCWLIVERLRCPGNFGTILRTAEAVGVGGVICLGRGCDPFDPAVVRASMGGMFHLPLVCSTHAEFADWKRRRNLQVVGLSPEAQTVWTAPLGSAPLALMIGDEREGLSVPARTLCDSFVRLPMTGTADSLNVGVAAGVMLYELVRRAAG